MPPITLWLETPDCLLFIVLSRITLKIVKGAKQHFSSIFNFSRLSRRTIENDHLYFPAVPIFHQSQCFHRLFFQGCQFVQAPLMACSLITLALSVSIVMLKLLTGLKKRQKRRNMNATQARLQTKDSIPFTFGKCCQIMAKIGDFLKTGRGVQWPRWCLKQIIIDFCCPNRTCRLLQPKSWFILGKISWEKSCLLLFCLGVLRL